MGDVRETYMMAVTCPTGGHHNILRYAETIEEEADEAPAARRDDVPVGRHAVLDPGHQDSRVGHDQHEIATQSQEGHGGRGDDAILDLGEGDFRVQVQADAGGGMAKAVDGEGDVRGQPQLMTVEVLPQSKLKREVTWPRMLIV